MTTFRPFAIAAFFLLMSLNALGQTDEPPDDGGCSDSSIERVSRHLRIRHDGASEVVASACKRWPYDPALMIVAFAYDAGIEGEKSLVIALVDTARNGVEAVYRGAIEEDAAMTVGGGSLKLDTARYDIAPGTRAFGLDLSTAFSQGCVGGGLGPVRSLYVRDGKTIRPVLEGFYLSTWQFAKGGPSCATGERAVVIETTSYKISVLKSETKGFKDLRITARSTLDNHRKSRRESVSYTVRYDGETYPAVTR